MYLKKRLIQQRKNLFLPVLGLGGGNGDTEK